MAHPKRKISKTRRDKRRTHYKASESQIATCKTTGEAHLYHRAHCTKVNYTTEVKF
jgi:large subunit ribosomal protein L32